MISFQAENPEPDPKVYLTELTDSFIRRLLIWVHLRSHEQYEYPVRLGDGEPNLTMESPAWWWRAQPDDGEPKKLGATAEQKTRHQSGCGSDQDGRVGMLSHGSSVLIGVMALMDRVQWVKVAILPRETACAAGFDAQQYHRAVIDESA